MMETSQVTELSGIVAILDEAGEQVIEIRDLGPDPVAVKPGRVLPVVDVRPTLTGNQAYGDPMLSVGANAVTRTFPAVEKPLPVVTISKDDIWRRATDAEADQMDAALAAQSARLRNIYQGATFIRTDDELFDVLRSTLVGLFGEARADELLAASAEA